MLRIILFFTLCLCCLGLSQSRLEAQDGYTQWCDQNDCCQEYQCGDCYCLCCKNVPCYFKKWDCQWEPQYCQVKRCQYVPQYYEQVKCRYVPQYYTTCCCRYVPQYYYDTVCTQKPRWSCHTECKMEPKYYYKRVGNPCNPCR
jgi:hypothetical protein